MPVPAPTIRCTEHEFFGSLCVYFFSSALFRCIHLGNHRNDKTLPPYCIEIGHQFIKIYDFGTTIPRSSQSHQIFFNQISRVQPSNQRTSKKKEEKERPETEEGPETKEGGGGGQGKWKDKGGQEPEQDHAS